MVDLPIAVRGVVPAYSEANVTVASDPGTRAGDYVMVVASVDYLAAASNPAVQGSAGMDTWAVLGAAADPVSGSTVMSIRAWLGRVTADGPRSVSVTQAGTSGLHVAVFTLDPAGGILARDGAAAAIVDRSTPYAHSSLTPTGAMDLLVVAHAGVQFTPAVLAHGPAPSGMVATTVPRRRRATARCRCATSSWPVRTRRVPGHRRRTCRRSPVGRGSGSRCAHRVRPRPRRGRSRGGSSWGSEAGTRRAARPPASTSVRHSIWCPQVWRRSRHATTVTMRSGLAGRLPLVIAAGAALALMTGCGPDQPVPPPASAVAPPALTTTTTPAPTTTPAAPTTTKRPRATPTTRSRTTTPRPAANSGAGCGQRAVNAGKYNPGCSEYQGYLDPGRGGGREPNSADIQRQDACERGQIPASEC